MYKKKKLVFNTIIILIGKICTQLLSFLLLPLYTSYLISSEYGIVDLIITYISLLVPVLSIQLDMAVFRFLIDYRKNKEISKRIIATNILSLIFISFFIIFFSILFKFVFEIKFYYLIISIIIATMLNNDLMQIYRGIGDNVSYTVASVISGCSTIILNVVFIVILKLGAKGMLLAMLFANIICFIFQFFKLKISRYLKIKYFDISLLKQFINYSMPLIPNGISWWIMSASDRTIISFILSVGANGIYAVSNKFPSLLTSFFGIFNLAWCESAALNIKDNEKNKFFSSVCNDIIRIFGACGLMILSIMPFVFPILINKQYNEAYLYIPILLISSIFSLIGSQYGSIYIAVKQTKKLAKTTLLSAIINVFVHLLLIKFLGLYAAAISTAVSYFVIMIYRHFDIQKYVRMKYESRILYLIISLYILTLFTYYLNLLFYNIVSFIVCIIFSFIINQQYIKIIYNYIRKYIKKIKGADLNEKNNL